MCRCTPEIRTPFCGKPGCEWPEQALQSSPLSAVRRLNDDLSRAVLDAKERGVTDAQIALRLADRMQVLSLNKKEGS